METDDEHDDEHSDEGGGSTHPAAGARPGRRVGVVVNPERTDVSDDVIDRLRALGCAVTAARPDTPLELSDAVGRLVADGVEVVAAVGGDGTQRTAAAALLDTEVALAVIPGGTVNLLAQVLDVADLDRAVDAAANGTTRMIDVGTVKGDEDGGRDEVFVLNASTGWDAAVIEHVDDSAKRFGRLGYIATGLVQWFRAEPRAVAIEIDGRAWYDDPALTVLVMNVGERASDALHLAPDAEFDDGRLDVVVLRRHSAIGFARSAWNVLRNRPAPSADVATTQGREIVVTWTDAVSIQRDGDASRPGTCLRYASVPGRLRVMVPTGGS